MSFTTLDGSAAEFGGGIFNNGGTVSIKNSLLSNSRGGNCAFEISSLGHNLSSDASCIGSLVELTDLNNVDPLLDPEGLKANGGPTLTVALLADSPAIDAVPESACTDGEGNPVTTDQRGIQRPSGSGCDIGAYEAQGGGGNEG